MVAGGQPPLGSPGLSAEGRGRGDVVATGGWPGLIAASLSGAAGCVLVAVMMDAVVVPPGLPPRPFSREEPGLRGGRTGALRGVAAGRQIDFRARGLMIHMVLSILITRFILLAAHHSFVLPGFVMLKADYS